MKNKELKIYGRNACLGLFRDNPDLIIRAYHLKSNRHELKELLKYLAQHKKAYHEVTSEELESIASSHHHEGIVFLIKKPKQLEVLELLKRKNNHLIIALIDVDNPHNLGAMMRSAAHFGISGMIVVKDQDIFNAAFFRTAEGGALKVPLAIVKDLSWIQEAIKLGYQLYTTSSHEKGDLYTTIFKEKTIVFFGSEGLGLQKDLFLKIKNNIYIPGSGDVESLNVTQAGTILMSEWFRQQRVLK
jgi:TrmH RNA methyltransferase